MASEILESVTFSVQNPRTPATGQLPFKESIAPLNLQLTQNAPGANVGQMNVPITAGGTPLPLGGVTVNGFVVIVNLDTVNSVQWGPTVAGAMVVCGKIKPGEASGPWRLDPATVLRLQANGAPVNVQFWLFQD
jgi:hypothetical protein